MQEKNNTPVNFAEHLASLLAQRGLTQKRFAEAVGSSQASVVKWLNGSVPLGSTLNRIAEYFGLHPDYLLNPARYDESLIIPAQEAEELEGTASEKSAHFSRRALEELEKRSARREGFDAAASVLREGGIEADEWKSRALRAEDALAEMRSTITSFFADIPSTPREVVYEPPKRAKKRP